jgi:hypothetical protein
MIYLAYFLGNIAIIGARSRGWPKVDAPFKLGKWGMTVNILALLYGGAMLINFAWPRAASNPEPDQTGGLVHFGIGWLDRIPLLYSVLGLVMIIGVIYYFLSEVRKPLPVDPPSESGAFVIPPESLPYDESGPQQNDQ